MIVFTSKNIYDSGISGKEFDKLKVSSFLDKFSNKQKLYKFASSGDTDYALRIFTKAISEMNIKTEIDLGELFKRIFAASNEKPKVREESIKIASKEIKDSHYQIDVSKDIIEKNGATLFMVSAYLRDAYLGRYLIKRNYFYLPDNEKQANNTFDEITEKCNSIKNKYYNDKTNIENISSEVTSFLQNISSDLKMQEDDLGTTVKRGNK